MNMSLFHNKSDIMQDVFEACPLLDIYTASHDKRFLSHTAVDHIVLLYSVMAESVKTFYSLSLKL